LRNFKLDTTIADFCLRAKSRWPIVFGGQGRHEQYDPHPNQNRLQHKRRVHGGIDRRWAHTKSNFSRSSGNSVDKFASGEFSFRSASVGSLAKTTRW